MYRIDDFVAQTTSTASRSQSTLTRSNIDDASMALNDEVSANVAVETSKPPIQRFASFIQNGRMNFVRLCKFLMIVASFYRPLYLNGLLYWAVLETPFGPVWSRIHGGCRIGAGLGGFSELGAFPVKRRRNFVAKWRNCATSRIEICHFYEGES